MKRVVFYKDNNDKITKKEDYIEYNKDNMLKDAKEDLQKLPQNS